VSFLLISGVCIISIVIAAMLLILIFNKRIQAYWNNINFKNSSDHEKQKFVLEDIDKTTKKTHSLLSSLVKTDVFQANEFSRISKFEVFISVLDDLKCRYSIFDLNKAKVKLIVMQLNIREYLPSIEQALITIMFFYYMDKDIIIIKSFRNILNNKNLIERINLFHTSNNKFGFITYEEFENNYLIYVENKVFSNYLQINDVKFIINNMISAQSILEEKFIKENIEYKNIDFSEYCKMFFKPVSDETQEIDKNMNEVSIKDSLEGYELRQTFDIPLKYYTGGIYKLFLVVKNGLFYLIDKGITLKCLNEIYELGEPDVIKNLVAIMKLFGVKKIDDNFVLLIDYKEEDVEYKNALEEAKYKFIACISFMDSMRIFYM
jgi:hypothetical protein